MLKTKTTNMEREIIEQAIVLPLILDKYINPENNHINIDLPQNIKRIVLVASGSSYHCARFAVDLVEKISKIETRAIYSSEFLLKNVIPHDENTLYIFITQSGETSDTLKSLERVKSETNLPTLCVTNKENSSIWGKSNYRVACHAGEEIGIAATKSFTAQILCLILISLKLIENHSGDSETIALKKSLKLLSDIINSSLAKRKEIRNLAKHLAKEDVVVITADGISYSLAKEATLKIKETSYKNICATILGEFMHGHVAVLNNKKSSFIYISADDMGERSIYNINKIKEDYNPTIIVIGKSDKQINADYHIETKCDNVIQYLFANVIIIQLLSLEIALKLKRNVDNPKGLHKIVTK